MVYSSRSRSSISRNGVLCHIAWGTLTSSVKAGVATLPFILLTENFIGHALTGRIGFEPIILNSTRIYSPYVQLISYDKIYYVVPLRFPFSPSAINARHNLAILQLTVVCLKNCCLCLIRLEGIEPTRVIMTWDLQSHLSP